MTNLVEAASNCGLPEISLFTQCLSDSGLNVFENAKDLFKAVRGEGFAGCQDKKRSTINDAHDGSFNF